MRVFVRLLDEQAKRCIELAHECQNKDAERYLKLLAVDLMLECEQHKARIPKSPEPKPVVTKAVKPKSPEPKVLETKSSEPAMASPPLAATAASRSNPEVLRELEALRLVVRADTEAV